jgi:hypothetical protein
MASKQPAIRNAPDLFEQDEGGHPITIPRRTVMNTEILSNDIVSSDPEVLILTPETPLADVMRFQQVALDGRSWHQLVKLLDMGMPVELHAAEDPTDEGWLRAEVLTEDPLSALHVIRYGKDDWTVEYDRAGDARLSLDAVSRIALDLNHAVFLANELNAVNN